MLSLPHHPHVKLGRAPISSAALQVHFEDVGDVVRSDARAVQKALGLRKWSDLQAQQIITGVLGPAGFGQQPARPAWQIKSSDGQWAVVLHPDSVALEVNEYPGWQGYKAAFQALVRAIGDVIGPQQSRRLGLRYVNQIQLPPGHKNWDGLIPAELLGPAAGQGPFAGSVVATEQRIILDVANGIRCLMRHGMFVDQNGSNLYLLDYDIYRETPTVFDTDAIIGEAEVLHETVYDVFRATITDDLFQYLK